MKEIILKKRCKGLLALLLSLLMMLGSSMTVFAENKTYFAENLHEYDKLYEGDTIQVQSGNSLEVLKGDTNLGENTEVTLGPLEEPDHYYVVIEITVTEKNGGVTITL